MFDLTCVIMWVTRCSFMHVHLSTVSQEMTCVYICCGYKDVLPWIWFGTTTIRYHGGHASCNLWFEASVCCWVISHCYDFFVVLCLILAVHVLQQQQQQPFNGRLSGTTRVGRYQKKHSPAHTHPGQCTSFITFLHLQRSMASSLFSLHAWQSSRTTSFQVLFGLPLGLEPSTSYSMHFFTQSSSAFRSTCPYQRSLFCCNIKCYVLYT